MTLPSSTSPTHAVVGTVKVGQRPYAVALANGRAFTTDQYASTVTVFDTGSLARLATIAVGDYPRASPPAGMARASMWRTGRATR